GYFSRHAHFANCRRLGHWRMSLSANRRPPPDQVRGQAPPGYALHPAVRIGTVLLHRRQLHDFAMVRREMAHRIGRARVAGERERLAAATAEVDLAPLAGAAELGKEVGAAERVEGGRRDPDVGERMLLHGPELEARNALRR